MEKKVSVIIPCYNAEKHIDISIDSVYRQDYPSIELIVVNDGSVDRTEEKVLVWQKKFIGKGYILKYLSQNNQGAAAATNLALKYVTGEYLTLLDADDRFLPGSIAVRAQFLDAHTDYAGVRTNGWRVNGEQRSLFVKTETEKRIEDLFTALSTGKTNNWAGTYMVRTDILFEMYPERNVYPSRFGQNLQILLPVAYKRKFGYIDEPLMEYIIQENSHSHAADPKKQYELSKRNSEGWRDIYCHVLDDVVKDTAENEKFRRMYNEVHWRRGLYDAVSNEDREAAQNYYQKLVNAKCASAEDGVVYYQAIQSYKQIWWKILLKLKHYKDKLTYK